MNGWNSGRVWKRQPLAVLASSTARPAQSSRSSSSSRRRMSGPTSSSNSRFRSTSESGSCDESSAASMMRLASAGFCMGDPDVNRREPFRLRDVDQGLAREFEQREEGNHQNRDAEGRIEQLGEFEHAALLEAAQDLAHVLAHRKLLARHAM